MGDQNQWSLQSNQIGGGPPPPPPPPPLSAGPGYIPGARLNTEIGPREPPATIQNAMMSKDKKPFTYTPGGLDLSQIRSPRMQKRISRNAQAEGVPPQPAQAPGGPRPAPGPLPPSALAAMQTQLPVAVFPTGAPAPPPPPPPPANFPSQTKQYSPPPPAPPFIPENYFSPPPPTPQPLQVSSPTSPGSGTGSLYVPPVQTSRAQLGSLYIPPVQQQQTPSPPAPPQPSPPSASTSTTSPSSAGTPVLNKTTPAWLSGQREQEQRKPQNLPPWVREEQEQQQFEQNQKPTNRQPIQQQQIPITRPPPQQQQIPITRPPPQQQQIPITTSSGANAATRIIPIQIEGRDPPPNINQQQQFQSAPQRVQQPQQQQQQTRIIPIQIEGQQPVTTSNGQRKPGNTQNKFNQPTTPGAGQIRSPPVSPPTPQYCESPQEGVQSPRQLQTQQSWSGNNGGPVQSRSFRVLQRMTDTIDGQENNTDPSQAQQWGPQNTQGVPVNQLRKMQLTDDDRALMNKFKAQVDGEGGSLHTEEDPRYRGAAIPSRAFRALQTMTGETNDPVPRGPLPGPHNKPTVASTVENVPQGAYVPPSEQTAPEPRKYTGGAIPSRSFRMLQAMTAPENCAPDVSTPASVQSPVSAPNWPQPPYSAPPAPPYWPAEWWSYYAQLPPPPLPPPPGSESPTGQQQPPPTPPPPAGFWDPYSMYAYYGYPPPPYPPYGYPSPTPPPGNPYQRPPSRYGQSDDEFSGYSSTDEMSYYGARFQKAAELNKQYQQYQQHMMQQQQMSRELTKTPSIVITPSSETHSVSEEDTESDSDTEVEEDATDEYSGSNSNAKSSESSVYKDEEDEEIDSDDDDIEYIESQNEIPHQLSVIFEESEHSDVESVRKTTKSNETLSSGRSISEDESSTATLDNEEDESDVDLDPSDRDSATVTVRLPLKLKFSRSENDEEVTTLIVGDSQRLEKTSSNIFKSLDVPKDVTKDNETAKVNNNNKNITAKDSSKATITAKQNGSPNTTNPTSSLLNNQNAVNNNTKTNCEKGGEDSVSVTFSIPSPSPIERTNSKISKNLSNTSIISSASCDSLAQSQLSTDDIYETATDSDEDSVSIRISLPNRKTSDSSGTSVQTVIEAPKRNKEKASDSKTPLPQTKSEIMVDRIYNMCLKGEDSETSEEESSEDYESEVEVEKKNENNIKVFDNVSIINTKNTIHNINKQSEDEEEEEEDEDVEEDDESVENENKESVIDNKPVETNTNYKSDSEIETDSEEDEDDDDEEEEEEDEEEEEEEDDEEKLKNDLNNKEKINYLCNGTVKQVIQIKSEPKMCANEKEVEEERKNRKDLIFKATHKKESGIGEDEEEDESDEDNLEKSNKKTTLVDKIIDLVAEEAAKQDVSKEESKEDTSKEESEDDSGVTSDVSRHISDTESDSSEMRRICQRASTHSRLFKLLQEECGAIDDENEESGDASNYVLSEEGVGALKDRKEHLTLPLQASSDPESQSSSSGVTSPGSPTITDRLVKELVHSLLHRKKGKKLKKLPLAKLHAAALRILQEDMDPYDTMSSTGSEDSSNHPNHKPPVLPPPPIQNPYYSEYCNYYDTWATGATPEGYYDNFSEYEIMPSKAFRLLSEHTRPGFAPGAINGLWARCPRIPSSKNLSVAAVTVTGTNSRPATPS